MKIRTILFASAAVALVAAAPARAEGDWHSRASATAFSKAASEVEKNEKKPAAKKAAVKKSDKQSAKNTKKQDPKAAKSEEAEKKPTLFSALFGGPVDSKKADVRTVEKPAKPMTRAEKAAAEKAAKAQAARQKKEETARILSEEKELVSSLDDGRPVELRSDVNKPQPGFFNAVFGGASTQRMLPETERRDRYLKLTEAKKGAKKFVPKEEFMPRVVDYDSSYKRGTIVVNTAERRLYLIESSGKARRYAIAVGRQGLEFKGDGKVGDKQEWPRWIPTQDMQKRDPGKYGKYKDGMDGGPTNPLGARAIYLYQGKKDTHIRVHGTTEPWSIGTSASNGCFRMINEHVMDLYNRVPMGADFVVL
ncbi:MAG: L,D-transpeptidase [Mesorhizobium sp.]